MKQDSHSEKMKKYRKRRKNRRMKKKILLSVVGAALVMAVLIGLKFAGNEFKNKTDDVKEQTNEENQVSQVTITESEIVGNGEETGETESPTDLRAQEILTNMTLEEKVYQLFVVTQEQLTGVDRVTQSGEATRNAIEKYPVGGIIYFSPNLISREQCMSMIGNIQEASKIGLFIAVDEEGGTVARLGKNPSMGTTSFASMGSIGESGDPEQAYQVGYTIGTEMKELGFNLDFAPVADVWSNPENKVIGARAFSTDPDKAADMVASCVAGFLESETLCTLKHFPGHGDTASDSHYGKVFSAKTLEELRACELIPFKAGIEAGAPFVMVGHINLPNVTEKDIPATFSYEVITELLRNEMGFQGIVITDSMVMQAVTEHYSSGEAAVQTILAGTDMILMPQNLQDAASGLIKAVEEGVITEERIDESVLRILKVKISEGIIAD